MKGNGTYYTTASDFKSGFVEMFGNGKWEQRCLGEVGTFKRGGGFQKSDYVEHGIPCIHYGQIHTKYGPFISSHISEISSDLESKTKFAYKGDLIIAITSEDVEGSCKSTAWLGDYPVAVGGHAAIYNHSMNPLYMSFFFKSTLFHHAKIEYVHGTKVFEIRPDDIAKILVPCPPMRLQEQFAVIAEQADKSEFELKKSIAAIDLDYRILFQQAQPNQANVHPCSQKGIVKMGKINYFCSSSCMKQTIYGKLS